MKKVPHIRFGIMLVMFLIHSCSTVVVATPTLEHSSPVAPTPTLEQPSPVPVTLTLTSTAEILTPTPSFEPPEGFKEYQDALVGVSVFIPESWVAIEVDPGQLAYLQSYPEDKYIGGEAFQSGDTKCDFYIRPPGTSIDELIQQWTSDSFATIISDEEIVLQSGLPGTKIELDNRGRSITLFTEINERIIVLTCFGELEPFNQIAISLSVSK